MKTFRSVGIVAVMIFFFSFPLSNQDIAQAGDNKSDSNLLKNGDYEKTEENDDWKNSKGPENWSQWKASGDPDLSLDDNASHSGKKSAKIHASSEGRASVEQTVEVQPEKEYKLTGWVKTEDVKSKHGARVRLTFQNSEDEDAEKVFKYTKEVAGTADWTKVELIVQAPRDYDTVHVQSFLEEGTGTAWFDDINFEEWDSEDDIDNKTVFSFESKVPDSFSSDGKSALDITKDHHKDGKHSLKWDFDKGSEISIDNRIGFQDEDKDVFGFWVYNEEPIDDDLSFQFGHGEETDVSFNFNLNFKGWRTAWVPYKDMEGDPETNMDKLTVTAPENQSGTLFLDQMIISSSVDERYPTRDEQVPFVNKEADDSPSSNWQSLYLFDSWMPEEFETEVTEKDKNAIDSIEEKYKDYAINNKAPKTPSMSRNITDEYMEELRDEFSSYSISRQNGTITGRPVVLDNIKDIYPNDSKEDLEELTDALDVRDYTDLMKKVAIAYHSVDKEEYKDELEEMFLDLMDHMYDQGWAKGSSLGSIHHYGYQIRSFYPAVFLMKDVLKENDKLDRTQEVMGWFSGIGRIYEDLDESYGDTDIFNTNLRGMLAYILIQDDPEEKVSLINRLHDWLSNGLQPAPGLMPMLKSDGSAYHHMGSYPTYARDSLEGLTPVVYMLSETPFSISESAHKTLKKAVLASRLFSNKYDWLVGVGGRHPTNRLKLESYPFKYMALAGTPDGEKNIDPESAEAYLRLVESDEEDETTDKLKSMGYEAESDPNGNWTMNKSVLELHRRDDWLVGVMGHNRYHWSNEIYASENLYGRYTNYGQIQILDHGDPINYEDSGYTPEEGWDWNRWPGTTTKHLPLDKLKAESPTEMLLTDEAYAGGLNIQKENGMYAMKIHENPKYDESFKARKSVFMFDNRIIALGSDVEDEDSEYHTETTLFQNHLDDNNDPISMSGQKDITDFPYQDSLDLDENTWILDNKKNGFYIPAEQKLNVRKQAQKSRDHHDKEDTEGDFATAWIDHGKAPDDESYEYAILVDSNEDEMNAFSHEMANSDTAPYTVLQKDKNAHIVRDKETKTTGYAIMEANHSLDKGHIISADTPSMVMIKEKGSGLTLSEVDPDWRLYDGKDPDQYDEAGKFVGDVSPFSVSWKENFSKMHKLQLTIKGEWDLKEKGDNYRVVSNENDRTVLEFDNKDAAPIEIELSPKSVSSYMDELGVLIDKYMDSEDIDPTFGQDLEHRFTMIQRLLEKGDKKQVNRYLEDFSKHINDPSVQRQHLLSKKATKDINRGIETLLEKIDK